MPPKKKPDWEPDTAPCPFENDGFLELWIRLLKMPKWAKKPVSAIELACNKLKRYHIDFAASLVENAIIGNYQGVVFADTDMRYENWKFNRQKLIGNQNGKSVTENREELVDILSRRDYERGEG